MLREMKEIKRERDEWSFKNNVMVPLKQTNMINIVLLGAATFRQFVLGSSAECVDDYNVTACVLVRWPISVQHTDRM